MKSIIPIALVTVAFAAFHAPASAQVGPYISLGGGIHMPRSSNLLVGTTAGNADFDNGWLINGAFGYKWDSGVRLEAELGWREADVDNFNGTPWTGSQKTWSTMGNLLYDFNTDGDVTPYLGVGAGVSWVGWKNNFKGPTTPTFDGTDSKFTWQGIAGVGTSVNEKLKFYLEYRYIATGNTSFPANIATATPVVTGHKDRSHNVLVGFRYSFGTPPAKAAPPPPPAPPRAAPPPAPPPPRQAPPAPAVPQKFLVFFDWDRANLRTDAAKIVSDAAAYAKSNGKAQIMATGHADTSGPNAYNLGLSERRAEAVKAELIRLGIPANEIVVMFKGEEDPLVATGDGVREPQNRRVEIVME